MTSLVLWIGALTLSGCALLAQNLPGTWQGALQIPQAPRGELRLVMKISTTAADSLAAVVYSIDQPGRGVPAASVTRNGAGVRIAVPAIGATYEGRFGADGNTITGTWTQGQAPLPLTLVRATTETAWTIPDPPPPPKLMAADASPSFEVATIKPSKPGDRFSLLVNPSGMLNTTGTSLADLLKFAYDLHPRQVSGGPAWLESEKFSVTGKPDTPGMPNGKQLKAMVQKLLADRFELKFHYEKKELPVYAIEVAKTGVKMTKNESNPLNLPGFGGGPRALTVRNATITEFAQMIQAQILDQPAVDHTGLGAARWDFVLSWTPDPGHQFGGGPAGGAPPAPAADNPDAPPDLFAAFQQQLGLRLQPTKAPVDVLVFDHVVHPSGN